MAIGLSGQAAQGYEFREKEKPTPDLVPEQWVCFSQWTFKHFFITSLNSLKYIKVHPY